MAPAPAISFPTDQHLLLLVHEGRCEDALAEIMDRHGAMVHATCLRITGHHHDAEESTQAVFLILLRKAGGLRRVVCLAAWLHQVARFVALRARRTRLRRRRHEEELSALDGRQGPVAQEPAGRDNAGSDDLDAGLARLPELYRLPILLHYFDGLSCAEICNRIGTTEAAVAMRLSRGKAMLKRRLGERFTQQLAVVTSGIPTMQPIALKQAILRSITHGVSHSDGGAVATLVQGSLHAMRLAKIASIGVVCGSTAAVLLASGLLVQSLRAAEATSPPAAPPAAVAPAAIELACSFPIEPRWRSELFAALARPVTLQATGVDAFDLLRALSRQCGIAMVLPAPASARRAFAVTIAVTQRPLQEILDRIAAAGGMGYMTYAGGLLWQDASETHAQMLTMSGESPTRACEMRRYFQTAGAHASDDGAVSTRAQDLIDRLKHEVAPDNWDKAGVSIEELGGDLIICQQPALQAQIEQFVRTQQAKGAGLLSMPAHLSRPAQWPASFSAVPPLEQAMSRALDRAVELPQREMTIRGFLDGVAERIGVRLIYADDAGDCDRPLPARRLSLPARTLEARHALCLSLVDTDLRLSVHVDDGLCPGGSCLLVSHADRRQAVRRTYRLRDVLAAFGCGTIGVTPEDVEDFIKNNVARSEWSDHGMSIDGVDAEGISIVQTPEVHHQISALLTEMTQLSDFRTGVSPMHVDASLPPLMIDATQVRSYAPARPRT